MEKLIDEILDIFIENVSCTHNPDSDGTGRVYDHVEYDIDEARVKEKIKKLIKEKLEPWIEEKSDELWAEGAMGKDDARGFIEKLANQGGWITVTEDLKMKG